MTNDPQGSGGAGGFENLRAWQEAAALHQVVEELTKTFPDDRAKLREQMRDAARSVHACIAEGAGRSTKRDFARMVDIARGSLREFQSDVATLPHALATPEQLADLRRRAKHTDRLIAGLLKYLRSSEKPRPPDPNRDA